MTRRNSGIESILQSISNPVIRPGLSRMSRLLSKIGHPERGFPAIHVAGTNGKGSISAMLESCFLEAGYVTALYTSPHLVDIRERLRFSGIHVKERFLLASVKAVESIISSFFTDEDKPTYFEVLTAAAFHCICQFSPDIAIIEAGMGGRLDATNILSNVVLSVISSIGKDHSEYLGTDLETIAMEKFLILRPGGESVFSGNNILLEDIYLKLCEKIGNKGTVASQIASFGDTHVRVDSNSFDLSLYGYPHESFSTSLGGLYQLENARTAIIAAFNLMQRFPRMDLGAIKKGLIKTDWPGRLESLHFGNVDLILDGAHNPEGISGAVNTLRICGLTERCGVVFAAMKDKDLPGMIRTICENFPVVVFTSIPGISRSAKPEALLNIAKSISSGAALVTESDPMRAVAIASADNSTVLCCGSLFLVGEIKKSLEGRLAIEASK